MLLKFGGFIFTPGAVNVQHSITFLDPLLVPVGPCLALQFAATTTADGLFKTTFGF
jgi:hypothetical protein